RGHAPEDRHLVTEGDDGVDEQRARHRDERGDVVDDLVGRLDRHVLLEQELARVREGLPRTLGAVPVGAGPQLHARDEPTLEPQREQHAHEQEDDDPDRLEQPDPPVVVREVRDRVRRGEQRAQGHGVHAVTSVAAFATATTLPPPARSVGRTREPGELPGSHTTWSAIGVTRTGNVIVPCSVLTATCSPSATPSACAVAADSRATGLLAVPARYGSPSWPRSEEHTSELQSRGNR